jgi:two-component system sensor histidine kinase UhpB
MSNVIPGLARALALDLRWKILIANAALVAAAALVGALVGGDAPAAPERALAVVVLGAALTIPINGVLVGTALRPLRSLEETAERVASGDFAARAPASPLADRTFRRLVATFNRMLNRVETLEDGLRQIAMRVTESAEDERRLLAERLREDTAQTLAAALLSLRRAGTLADDAERTRELVRVRDGLAAAMNGSTDLADGLRPPGLDALGLKGALGALARRAGQEGALAVTVEVSPLPEIPERVELTLYRVAEEALVNAVRHAQADAVAISLAEVDGELVLEVADDGQGFDFRQSLAQGLGLLWLCERVRALGGRADVDSAPGRGTRVKVSVPTKGGRSR